jgi:hypothetical protein
MVLASGCSKGTDTPKAKKKPPSSKAPQKKPAPRPTPPQTSGKPTRTSSITAKDVQAAMDRLSRYVEAGARDPTNAWALAHGLVAFGKDHTTTNGELAIDVLVRDFAIENNGKIEFPETAAGQPVEPHEDLIVKAMLESGVSLTRRFKLSSGRSVTMGRLAANAAGRAESPTLPKDWLEYAWTLSAVLAGNLKPPKSPRDVIAIQALSYLEGQQAFLTDLMERGQPERVQKRKQLIYAHTCGGLHFVQAAVRGAAATKDPKHIARARVQLETILFRWEAERRIYRDYRRRAPQYRVLLLTQELKFYGHVVETLALANRWGVFEATEANRRRVTAVIRDLITTIDLLAGAYGNLDKVRKAKEQTYLDLIGDGCHAIRGLRVALVAFFAA